MPSSGDRGPPHAIARGDLEHRLDVTSENRRHVRDANRRWSKPPISAPLAPLAASALGSAPPPPPAETAFLQSLAARVGSRASSADRVQAMESMRNYFLGIRDANKLPDRLYRAEVLPVVCAATFDEPAAGGGSRLLAFHGVWCLMSLAWSRAEVVASCGVIESLVRLMSETEAPSIQSVCAWALGSLCAMDAAFRDAALLAGALAVVARVFHGAVSYESDAALEAVVARTVNLEQEERPLRASWGSMSLTKRDFCKRALFCLASLVRSERFAGVPRGSSTSLLAQQDFATWTVTPETSETRDLLRHPFRCTRVDFESLQQLVLPHMTALVLSETYHVLNLFHGLWCLAELASAFPRAVLELGLAPKLVQIAGFHAHYGIQIAATMCLKNLTRSAGSKSELAGSLLANRLLVSLTATLERESCRSLWPVSIWIMARCARVLGPWFARAVSGTPNSLRAVGLRARDEALELDARCDALSVLSLMATQEMLAEEDARELAQCASHAAAWIRGSSSEALSRAALQLVGRSLGRGALLGSDEGFLAAVQTWMASRESEEVEFIGHRADVPAPLPGGLPYVENYAYDYELVIARRAAASTGPQR